MPSEWLIFRCLDDRTLEQSNFEDETCSTVELFIILTLPKPFLKMEFVTAFNIIMKYYHEMKFVTALGTNPLIDYQ